MASYRNLVCTRLISMLPIVGNCIAQEYEFRVAIQRRRPFGKPMMTPILRALCRLTNSSIQRCPSRAHARQHQRRSRREQGLCRRVCFVRAVARVGRSGRSDGHPVGNRRGESGPRSRPMAEQWVAEIEAACRKARTAFFFKQWGGVRKKSTGRHYRGRTFDEMPRAVAMS
jgi:hypothetical protein